MKNHRFPSRIHIFFTILILIAFSTSLSAWMVQAQAGDNENDGVPAAEKGIGLAARFDGQDRLRVIVQLKVADQIKSAELMTPSIHQAQRDLIGQVQSGEVRVIHEYDFIPFMAMEVNRAGFEALRNNPIVVGIEEDVLMKPMLQESVPLIGADEVWLAGVTGAGQVVAILDTGVDKNHPALAGKVVEEACYSSNEPATSNTPETLSLCPGGVQESTSPDSGLPCGIAGCDHGTHVAGIVAADNEIIQGVAKDAKLIAIQVFSLVNGSSLGSWSSDQIKGLERVYELRETYNIASVNLSLGGDAYTSQSTCDLENTAYKAKVDLLKSAGIATIAASGNNGYDNAISSPACISSVISVGATTKSDLIASYSNSDDFLDLLAPGSNITSSVPGTEYEAWNGTSMATPHVAGAWALMRSYQPDVSVDILLDVLQDTGKPILDTRNSITKPRIDLLAAAPELTRLMYSPPIITGASNGSDLDKVIVTWVANVDADYYQIYKNTNGSTEDVVLLPNNPVSNSYNDTSATPGTLYYYWVKACHGLGCSNFSEPDTGWRGYEVIPPPEGVSASDGEFTDKVQVSWFGVGGADSYSVFRNIENSFVGAIELVKQPSSPYLDLTAEPGETFYYWVKACDVTDCSEISEHDTGWRGMDVLSSPEGVSASDGEYSYKIQVSWNEVGEASFFKVFRNTVNSTLGAITLSESDLNSPFDDTTALHNTEYYYWVQACNVSECSEFSLPDTGYLLDEFYIFLPLLNKNYVEVDPILNGDFEDGRNSSWTEYSSTGFPLVLNQSDLIDVGIIPRSGSWAVWLGGAENETSRLSQNVTISLSDPYLHFWYWIGSEDACGFDFFNLKVNNINKFQISLCGTNNSANWVEKVIDLSGYSASTVNIMFEVIDDDLLNSNLFLDDVSMSTSSSLSSSLSTPQLISGDYSKTRK